MFFRDSAALRKGPCATTAMRPLPSPSPACPIAPLRCRGVRVRPAPAFRPAKLRPRVMRSQTCPFASTTPPASTSSKRWETQIRPSWRASTSATVTSWERAPTGRRTRATMGMTMTTLILMIWETGKLCWLFTLPLTIIVFKQWFLISRFLFLLLLSFDYNRGLKQYRSVKSYRTIEIRVILKWVQGETLTAFWARFLLTMPPSDFLLASAVTSQQWLVVHNNVSLILAAAGFTLRSASTLAAVRCSCSRRTGPSGSTPPPSPPRPLCWDHPFKSSCHNQQTVTCQCGVSPGGQGQTEVFFFFSEAGSDPLICCFEIRLALEINVNSFRFPLCVCDAGPQGSEGNNISVASVFVFRDVIGLNGSTAKWFPVAASALFAFDVWLVASACCWQLFRALDFLTPHQAADCPSTPWQIEKNGDDICIVQRKKNKIKPLEEWPAVWFLGFSGWHWGLCRPWGGMTQQKTHCLVIILDSTHRSLTFSLNRGNVPPSHMGISCNTVLLYKPPVNGLCTNIVYKDEETKMMGSDWLWPEVLFICGMVTNFT